MTSDAPRPSSDLGPSRGDDAPLADSAGPAAFAPALLEHYGATFPRLTEALQKLLDPPPFAAEDVLRQVFASRRQLYASRTGGEFPKPVRQQNLTLLHQLDGLASALEAHIVALRAWRLLAEAAASIEQRHAGRARHRLDDAGALLAGQAPDTPLVAWLRDLEADLRQPPPPPPPPVIPRICSPQVARLRAGAAFEFQIVSEPAAERYQAEALPAGLHVETSTGRISGTVLEAGQHIVSLSALLADQVGHSTLVLTVEAPPPPPLLLLPSTTTAVVGQPFECAYVVWPAATPVVVHGLPPGLSLDVEHARICGTATSAGSAQIELTATGDGGSAHATLVLRINAVVTPTPRPTATDRFTLHLAQGRRLHVFAAPRVRLGRTAVSDLRVTVSARGAPDATRSLSGEISRQHAEVFLESGEARVCDGWRDSGSPSTFGTFLDAEKVAPPPGNSLRSGQVLRLTAHPPGPTVPHWRVRVLTPADAAGAPASLNAPGGTGASGVWLERLDDLPDDVLLLAGACDLATLGLSREPVWLLHTGGGFLIAAADGTPGPLEEITRAVAGSTLAALGTVHPFDLREALERASAP